MEQTKAKRKQNENINGYFLLKNQKRKKTKTNETPLSNIYFYI